jgi:hypothetical protein
MPKTVIGLTLQGVEDPEARPHASLLPFPSWSYWLSPQHRIEPSTSRAQLCCSPTAIDFAMRFVEPPAA